MNITENNQDIENMFQKISKGEITLEDFKNWMREKIHEGYCEGAANQNYYNSIG